jgi:hypothetical protein
LAVGVHECNIGTLTWAADVLSVQASWILAATEEIVGRQGLVDTNMRACGPIIVSCMEAARHCRVLIVNPRAPSAGKDPWTRPGSDFAYGRRETSSPNSCERLGQMHFPCNVRCPPQLDAWRSLSSQVFPATLPVPNRPSEPKSVLTPRPAICVVLDAVQRKRPAYVFLSLTLL